MSVQYSIIIPVYGAGNALEKLHQSIFGFFDGKYSYEIIYVDDFSTDASWETLKKIKAAGKNITAIRLSKNFGQHAATMCGFKYAQGEFMITLDDDLEVRPEEVEKLIAEQKKRDADVVYGEFKKINTGLLRSFLTSVYKTLSKIESKEKGKGSSFRLINGALAKKLCGNHTRFVFIDELLLWYTRKVSFVPVTANKEYIRKKRYRIGSLFSLAGNVILFSSTFPLKFVTRIGFILCAVNFLIGLYFLIKKLLLKIDVEGYASLIVSVLFSTGLIIFCIGILANYISHAIKAINNVPAYHEDEVLC